MTNIWSVTVRSRHSRWTYIRYVPQVGIRPVLITHSPQGMSFFVNRLRFLYPFQRFVESAIENGRLRYAVAVEYARPLLPLASTDVSTERSRNSSTPSRISLHFTGSMPTLPWTWNSTRPTHVSSRVWPQRRGSSISRGIFGF